MNGKKIVSKKSQVKALSSVSLARLQKIHRLFLKNKQTLTVAESCTGGLLSYWLTELSGSSQFFLGSVVSYSQRSKILSLQIPTQIFKKKGAVSEIVCQKMAQGVKNLWGSHWGLSLTGVAGPLKERHDPPIGTVFVGLAGPKGVKVDRILLNIKNRKGIRHQSAIFALDFLYFGIK